MRGTIGRDRPLIAAEVFASEPRAAEVVALLASLNYSSFVVQEQCGVHYDCRNLLAFPDETLPSLVGSPTLDLAARASMLMLVNASTVRRYAKRRRTPADSLACTNQWFCLSRFADLVPRRVLHAHADLFRALGLTTQEKWYGAAVE